VTRPSFEELLKIYRVGRMEVDHQTNEDRDTRSLRHVLDALPPAIELPCDEELGRIANEASWPEGRKFPSDREVGAAIRAKLVKP